MNETNSSDSPLIGERVAVPPGMKIWTELELKLGGKLLKPESGDEAPSDENVRRCCDCGEGVAVNA